MTQPEAGITVAGRVFRPVTSLTVERYNWIAGNIAACDLTDLSSRGEMLARVAAGGKTAHLLAGLYVEDGSEWSGATALKLVSVFSRLSIPDYRQFEFLDRLSDFFESVADSSPTSATASESSSTTPVSISDPPTSDATPTPSVSSALPSELVPATT